MLMLIIFTLKQYSIQPGRNQDHKLSTPEKKLDECWSRECPVFEATSLILRGMVGG